MKTKIISAATIASTLALTSATRVHAACNVTGGAQSGADCAKGSNVPTNLTSQIIVITNTMLLAIGIISVIMIIIGGIRYALSGGDEKGTAGAKDTILYAVVGLVVALLAYAIVNFVLGRF